MAQEIAPGGPEYTIAGEKATKESIARIRKELGLDRPWPVRYAEFVNNAVHGDLGTSYTGTKEPVIETIKREVPMTARLALYALIVASVVGVSLGVVGAIYRDKFPDKLVLFLSTLGVTIPNFVLAPILVYFVCLELRLLPLTWEVYRDLPDIYYLVLPVSLLALYPTAMTIRLTRASMIDTMQQEFVKFAIAKGVPTLQVIFKHALRNAILPVITGLGISFGYLLMGSFVIEMIFRIPGIGNEIVDAIQSRNNPVVMGGVIVTATMFTLINILIDVILPILDPRIREARI
jgi:ABC-type dipeptide/oligopeptide/nickel transport system permease component